MKDKSSRILYIIGFVISALIIVLLGLASVSSFGLCGFAGSMGYLPCVRIFFGIGGGLAAIFLVGGLVAWKHPEIGAVILLSAGVIGCGLLIYLSEELSPTEFITAPFFVVGLLYLSSAIRRHASTSMAGVSPTTPNATEGVRES